MSESLDMVDQQATSTSKDESEESSTKSGSQQSRTPVPLDGKWKESVSFMMR